MKKTNSSPPNLDALRHSCAHLLAAAVMELWPSAKPTIGPAIENGFYYDFDFAEQKISQDDLPKIEQRMREIVKSWTKFERIEVDSNRAVKQFSNNEFKKELIEEFAKAGEEISLYKSGNFVDLCRGGHVERPDKELKHFKLLSVAGAYWRGDEKNPMLTRIYGTAFPTRKELDHFLWQQEEAKKRDHKKLGSQLELFIFSANVGPGLPIFLPKGWIVRHIIEEYLIALKQSYGLIFVWTPHIARSELYKQSRHWQKYDAMMPPLQIEDEEYTLKPMNCPHHFQIYLEKPRSYRNLPLRLAENATVYRYEKSGEINGLLRVRAVTQDDSHWFVPHRLLPTEIDRAIDMTQRIFRDFGLSNYHARISVRDKNHPEKYLGGIDVWEKAEAELVKAVKCRKMSFEIGEGEAAFYGPKIDIMVKDSLEREWQLTTVQLDFNQPENFDMKYITADGHTERPAVLHIAILGALERFLAVLIEHYGGAFPLWLAPVQSQIVPITNRHAGYANQIGEALRKRNIRLEIDDRALSMQKRIRDAELAKIPYVLVVGDREAQSGTVAVRLRGEKNLGPMNIENLAAKLLKEIEDKAIF